MTLRCWCRDHCRKNLQFTALEGSAVYARELVDSFFQKYTKIDITLLELHTHKFPTPLLCVKRDLRPLIVKSINTSTQRSSRCYLNLRSDELNDMVPHTVIRIH